MFFNDVDVNHGKYKILFFLIFPMSPQYKSVVIPLQVRFYFASKPFLIPFMELAKNGICKGFGRELHRSCDLINKRTSINST